MQIKKRLIKEKLTGFYKKLLTKPKLSAPMTLILIFGVLLTVFITKQVNLIQTNTSLLKHEIIPAFEKSTENLNLLKNISEHLTFATLIAEEEMILEIKENHTIEQNLKDILAHKNLNFKQTKKYLKSFQTYFDVATNYAVQIIKNDTLADNTEGAQKLFKTYNEVQKAFVQLNSDLEQEVANKTALIEATSMQLIYYTVAYVIILSIVLFVTSDYSIIEAQRKELSKINKNVQLSIEYASLIQKSILPEKTILKHYCDDSFILWEPKDTVGGDVYFISELESKNEILIMVIDGVGHGVYGAFLTILTKALETQIIEKINQGVLEKSPSAILKYFNHSIKTILQQKRGSKSNVGFDGGILYYNKATKACKYAGAKTPLYIVNNNHLEVIQSDRKSVGFIRTKMTQEYTEYDIQITKETKLYISTDGIIDQEGAEDTLYGKERFEAFISNNHNKSLSKQQQLLKESFLQFKGDFEQSDDITIIGMKFQ